MATVLTNDANYISIADAIRAKGGEGTFTPAQMATAIANLPSGGANKVLTSAIITGTSSRIDISNYTTDNNFILLLGMREDRYNDIYDSWIITPPTISWSITNWGETYTDNAGIILANDPRSSHLTVPSSGLTKFYSNGAPANGYFAFGTYFSRNVDYSNGIFTIKNSNYKFATSSILIYLAEATI